MIYNIIPCGAEKLDHAAPARDLYTSSTFRMALKAAQVEADYADGRVLILSAKHGLIDPDTVIEPYDVKMGQPGAVGTVEIQLTALALGIDWTDDVYGFLPAAYRDALDTALRPLDIYVSDVYETAPGIGYQRGVLAIVARPLPSEVAA